MDENLAGVIIYCYTFGVISIGCFALGFANRLNDVWQRDRIKKEKMDNKNRRRP